jgi:hypothetical protein
VLETFNPRSGRAEEVFATNEEINKMKNEYNVIKKCILNADVMCICCSNKKAQDAHLIVKKFQHEYTLDDFIPVCFECRDLLRNAIKDEYISQDEKDFLNIKEKSINIKNDEEYKILAEWLNTKHFLTEDKIAEIKELPRFVIEKIKQLIGKPLWYDNLSDFKFYGRQIKRIDKIIETSKYRIKRI